MVCLILSIYAVFVIGSQNRKPYVNKSAKHETQKLEVSLEAMWESY